MRVKVQTIARLRQVLLVLLFVAAIILPAADWKFQFGPRPELVELRLMAERPTLIWTRKALKTYPARYEAYFNDAFGFRNLLTIGYNRMCYFWLRKSPVSVARVGRDGWLYFGKQDEQEAFQRINGFSPGEAQQLVAYFRSIQSWVEGLGKTFVMMIIPNKSTLYPEHMPANLRRAAGPSRLDQFVAEGRRQGLNLIDLRETYAQPRAQGDPIFYRLDAHWTTYGAMLAARDLLSRVLPERAVPPDLAQITWSTNAARYTEADMVRLMGLNGLLAEPLIHVNWRPIREALCLSGCDITFGGTREFETDAGDLPKAVFFRDSFAEPLLPVIGSRFSRMVAIWTYAFRPAVVQQEDPDVVMFEFVERILHAPSMFGNRPDTIARMLDVEPAIRYHFKTGINTNDASAAMGVVRRATPPNPRGWLLFGRYTALAPGAYEVSFRVRVQAAPRTAVARFDVSAKRGQQELGSLDLGPGGLPANGVWADVTLPFDVPPPGLPDVEYRVEYLGAGDLSIDSLNVRPRAAPAGDAPVADGEPVAVGG